MAPPTLEVWARATLLTRRHTAVVFSKKTPEVNSQEIRFVLLCFGNGHIAAGASVETLERLSHRIYPVVVQPERKVCALFDEIVHPGREGRMRQIDVAGLD